MIKAVTFDLDGVYFTADSFPKFKSNFLQYTNDQNKIDHVLSKSDEILNFKKGIMSEVDYWSYVNRSFGIDFSVDQFQKLISDSYSVNQNIVDMVKKVRGLGIYTCICTNNFPTRINALSEKFSFLSDFDIKIFSYEIGAIKPDSKIFQALINQSACLPHEIVITDDKEINVQAALSLGLTAFIYTGFSAFISNIRNLGLDI